MAVGSLIPAWVFELIPACHNAPVALFFVGCFLAVFMITKWAREESAPPPAWKWGDQPRREKREAGAAWAHIVGFVAVAFVFGYALSNPICGSVQ